MSATEGFGRRFSCRLSARQIALVLGALAVAPVTLLGLGAGAANAAFPGKNGKLAVYYIYFTDYDDVGHLSLMDSAGRVNKAFAKSPLGRWEFQDEYNLGPVRFSPDGTQLALSGYWPYGHVCVTRVDGHGRHCPVRGTEPAWSPNGRRLVFVSHPTRDTNRIATVRAAGGTSHAVGPGVDGGSPVVSKSGDIAFVRREHLTSPSGEDAGYQSHVWVMQADGSGLRQVTTGDDFRPDWSPDGKRLVFYRYLVDEAGQEAVRLCVVDLRDGSVNSIADVDQFAYDGGPVWSPDGKRIVFSSPSSYSDDIATPGMALIRPGGTGKRQLAAPDMSARVEAPSDWQPIVRHRR
jgi:Tol biopolymer transport system component